MADKNEKRSMRLTQIQLLNLLIDALAELYVSDKLITHVEVWVEGKDEPYIKLKQRRVSPEVNSILEGIGMYRGKKKEQDGN